MEILNCKIYGETCKKMPNILQQIFNIPHKVTDKNKTWVWQLPSRWPTCGEHPHVLSILLEQSAVKDFSMWRACVPIVWPANMTHNCLRLLGIVSWFWIKRRFPNSAFEMSAREKTCAEWGPIQNLVTLGQLARNSQSNNCVIYLVPAHRAPTMKALMVWHV